MSILEFSHLITRVECLPAFAVLLLTFFSDHLKVLWLQIIIYVIYFYLYCEILYPAAAVKLLQSCLTLCHPIDGSPSGSPIPGILQARRLEWVAISFSSGWKWKVKVKSLSRVWLPATPWTAAHQAPLSMGFSDHLKVLWLQIIIYANTFLSTLWDSLPYPTIKH